MSYSMSPFPLRFGSRQGGGAGDPTAITPANADAFLASLGLTQAGTGTTWGETGQAATPLYAVDAAKVPLAVETIGGKQYFGPIVNPAGTNLAQYGNDATNAAWSKSNIAPTRQTGSLNDAAAANGHSLLTATGANGTCLQAITSGSAARVTKFWLARTAGSGTVEITQNNGSTWAAVSLTSDPQPFNIAAATLANPTIGIRIVTSGDAVRLYGAQHQVAARPLRPYIGPTAGSTVTTGARSLTRTGLSSISEIDVELVLMAAPSSPNTAFVIDDETTSNVLYMEHTGSAFTVRRVLSSTPSQLANIDIAPGVIGKLDIQLSGSVFRARLNNGSWVTGTGGMPSGLSRIRIGSNGSAQRQWERPVFAIRDKLRNILPDAPYGWNHRLLDNWA